MPKLKPTLRKEYEILSGKLCNTLINSLPTWRYVRWLEDRLKIFMSPEQTKELVRFSHPDHSCSADRSASLDISHITIRKGAGDKGLLLTLHSGDTGKLTRVKTKSVYVPLGETTLSHRKTACSVSINKLERSICATCVGNREGWSCKDPGGLPVCSCPNHILDTFKVRKRTKKYLTDIEKAHKKAGKSKLVFKKRVSINAALEEEAGGY